MFFSFDHDKLLKLTADFSPDWTNWGNPGGKTVLLPNSNYLQPGLKSETWTLCQSLCNLLVRTIDLFLWSAVLSYHWLCFSPVPGNPASLAVHGHNNWKTDSIEEKASKIPSARIKGEKINLYMVQESEELFTVRLKSSSEGEISH